MRAIFEALFTGPIARCQACIVLGVASDIAIRIRDGTTNQNGHSDEDGHNELHIRRWLRNLQGLVIILECFVCIREGIKSYLLESR